MQPASNFLHIAAGGMTKKCACVFKTIEIYILFVDFGIETRNLEWAAKCRGNFNGGIFYVVP